MQEITMQNVWLVKAQYSPYEPADIVGIYDSEGKALEALTLAENALESWGSKRYADAWIDTYNLNETMDFT